MASRVAVREGQFPRAGDRELDLFAGTSDADIGQALSKHVFGQIDSDEFGVARVRDRERDAGWSARDIEHPLRPSGGDVLDTAARHRLSLPNESR